MSSVMVIGAVVGAVIGGITSVTGISKDNKNLIKAYKQKMQYVTRNYNYGQNALDRQQQSVKDQTTIELLQLNLNAMNNQAQVQAALGESGTEGRNSSKLTQVIKGQNIRQKDVALLAYETASVDLKSKKDALYIQTSANADQIYDKMDKMLVHGTDAAMRVGGAMIQGAAIGAMTAGAASAAGGIASSAASGAAAGQAGGTAAGATLTGIGASGAPTLAGGAMSTTGAMSSASIFGTSGAVGGAMSTTGAMSTAGASLGTTAGAGALTAGQATAISGGMAVGTAAQSAGTTASSASSMASTAANTGKMLKGMEGVNFFMDKYGTAFNMVMNYSEKMKYSARREYYNF